MTWLHFFAVILSLTAFFMFSPSLLNFAPNPYTLSFPTLTGPLSENDELSKAEHLHQDILIGPESIVIHQGDIYTGLKDGRIVKVKGDVITTVAQTGKPCKLPYEERKCGRPLGLRKGPDGLLYIVDAYYGIFTMNFTTGTLVNILSSDIIIDGERLNFPDDMDIDDDGNIYFSDASTKWDLSTILYMMFEYEAGGRVIRYNIHTGKTKILATNLHFPNGVQLSKDKKTLLICDFMNRRILRSDLNGTLEVLIDNLPGEPDNIRPSSNGYWIGIPSARSSTHHTFADTISTFVNSKRLFMRLHHAISSLIVMISNLTSNHAFKAWAYMFKRGDFYLSLIHRHGIIVEINESGTILRSLHSPDAKTCDLSEVHEHEGYLYLGSFLNNYLGRLKVASFVN